MTDVGVWAQLVSTTDVETEPIQLQKNKVMIGRNRGSDVCLSENPFVSSNHCFIERDLETGSVWLHDTSTNGTLLNCTEKLIRQKTQLKHGDEIYIVFRKADTAHNVAYVFQDMERLRREESLTSESSATSMNCTQPYDATFEEDRSADYRSPKRQLSEEDITQSDSKRRGESSSSGLPSSSKPKECLAPVSSVPKPTEEPIPSDRAQDLLLPEPVREILPLQPSQDHLQGSDASTVVSPSQESGKASAVNVHEPSAASTDEMQESLLCVICHEILYKCVSAQPCMHSFCAGCYSEWMQRSSECPSCRMVVERVNKNHLVNNLVEAYLKANPGKRRAEAELEELDAKNKITDEMLTIRSKRRHDSDDGTESDDYDDDDDDLDDYGDSDDDDSDYDACFITSWTGASSRHSAAAAPVRPNKTVCRQCPEYKAGASASAAASCVLLSSTDAVPSTSAAAAVSDAGTHQPTPPPYVCRPSQTHVLCSCCMRPMPDRRHDTVTNVVVPPQSCVICRRVYCHMYWGCVQPGCRGCLGKFSEFPVGQEVLARLILDNEFESDILKQCLSARQTTVAELLTECCRRLAASSYTCPDLHNIAGGSAVTCKNCFRRNFSELAYQYRRDIPRDELPADALNRPDCYWGRNCRTQKCKPAHARNYNHICDQTRLS